MVDGVRGSKGPEVRWLGVINESFQKHLVIGVGRCKKCSFWGGGRGGDSIPAHSTNFNRTPKQFTISVVISLEIQTWLKKPVIKAVAYS